VGAWPETSKTKYASSVKVQRSFCAKFHANMRYRLKFGDAFAAQEYQISVIGESAHAAKFCGQ